MKKKLLFIILMLLISPFKYAQPQEIRLYPNRPISPAKLIHSSLHQIDLIYNVSDPSLLAYFPEQNKSNRIAVIIAPGSEGFFSLGINNEGIDVAKALNAKGYTAFILKYTLMPVEGDQPDLAYYAMLKATSQETAKQFNKIVQLAQKDAHTAISHVRENAALYDIDPNKIAIIGFSSGGTVSLSSAYQYDENSRPNYVGALYPRYMWVPKNPIPQDAPPLFIATAMDDPFNLNYPQVIQLLNDWRRAKQSVDLHLFAKGGNFGVKQQGISSDFWVNIFDHWLSNLAK